MTSMRPIRQLAAVALVSLLPSIASAATITSNSGSNLPWENASTWVGGVVPGIGDDVQIGAGSHVVLSSATPSLAAVTIQGTGFAPSGDARLSVSSIGTLNVSGAATVRGGNAIQFAEGASSTLEVDGSVWTDTLLLRSGLEEFAAGGGGNLILKTNGAQVFVAGDVTMEKPSASGSPLIRFEAASTMVEIEGSLNGALVLDFANGGELRLAGDASATSVSFSGSGKVTLDGGDRQFWSGTSNFHDLVIANPSSYFLDGGAVAFSSSVHVAGTLFLNGGNVYAPGGVTSIGSISRTSGLILGPLQRAVTGGAPTTFPVGIADFSPLAAPVTVTPVDDGVFQVTPLGGPGPDAGSASILQHWSFAGTTWISALTLGYDDQAIRGSEEDYVAAGHDGSSWNVVSSTPDPANNNVSTTGSVPLLSTWTVGEPSAFTSAINWEIVSINEGTDPRVNTPFDIVIEGRDSGGNPASFGQTIYGSMYVTEGSGTLSQLYGGSEVVYFTIDQGETRGVIRNVLYDTAQLVELFIAADDAPFDNLFPVVDVKPAAASLSVETTADSGNGSLRRAIETANSGGCSSSPCPISFNLPQSEQENDGTWKISVGTYLLVVESAEGGSGGSYGIGLPPIHTAVILDATTQPGYDGAPVVEIDCNLAYFGLELDAPPSTVRGLAVHNAYVAMTLGGQGGHTIEANWFGMPASGPLPTTNTEIGIEFYLSNGNTVGGSTSAERNVIIGATVGLFVGEGVTGNIIQGNFIGLHPNGNAPAAEDLPYGVGILDSSNNVVESNVISGHLGAAIWIDGSFLPSDNNIIKTNQIGTNASGSAMIGNGAGIVVTGLATGNLLTENVIVGSFLPPIDLEGDEIVNANDPGDADTGANNLQNHPDVLSAELGSGSVTLMVQLDSTMPAPGSVRIEVFKADEAGQPEEFLGSQCVATVEGLIDDEFVTVPAGSLTFGDSIVTTATAYNDTSCGSVGDGTSEVSPAVAVSACSPPSSDFTAPLNACPNATGLVASVNTPTAGASYTWSLENGTIESGGGTSIVFSVGASGTATLTLLVTDEFDCASIAEQLIVITEPPSPVISGPTEVCETGEVTLDAGAGYVSYSWSTGETTRMITVSPGVTTGYSVTVEDGNGCAGTSPVHTVTVNPLPSPVITGPTEVCEGGSVVLDAGAGYSGYLWSTGETTRTISVSPASDTSYTVAVTDANGCSATSPSHAVTVITAVVPTILASGATTFCQGDSVTLTSSAASSYLWSTGETTQSIVVTTSGTYSVTTTDGNGCPATSAGTTVTVNTPEQATISADGPTTFCEGDSVTLSASAGAFWIWSTGDDTQSIVVTTAGSYSVIVYDANGCASSAGPVEVFVNAESTPNITASGPTTFCEGGSVTLSSSAGDAYQWYVGASPISGANSQTLLVTESGDYSVVVSGSVGCSGQSAPVTVTVHPPATAPVITPSDSTTFCEGGSVTLTSSTAASYLWSTGESTQSIVVTTSGTYSVTTTDGNGCPATSAGTTVTVNTPAQATITAQGPTTFCQGDSVTLTASSGVSWLWSTGATTQSIVVTTTGSYSVTITDANGCSSASAPVEVFVNASSTPQVTASGPTTFCEGGSVTLSSSGGDAYQWYIGTTPISGANSQTLLVTESGDYSVVVSSSVGCSGQSAPVTVTVHPAAATPVITPSGPTAFCEGGSVTLTSSTAASYLWSTGETTQSIVVSASGTYSVTITDGNGCPATSAGTTVTVNTPGPATISAGGPTTFCDGGSVTLTASAGVSWLWSTGATTQSIIVTTSGNYSVTITDANGCSSTSAPVVVSVTPQSPTPTITASGPTTFCSGGSVTLTSSFASTYLWSTGETTQSIVVSTTGSYSVTTTLNGGCPATSAPTSVTVNTATPATITSPTTSICPGGSVVLTASSGAAYQWYLDTVQIPGANAQTYTATTGGTYKAVVTSANSCPAESNAITITVTSSATPTITASGPTTFCEGGSVVLTSSTAGSYQWYRNNTVITGANGQSYTATLSGSYTVSTTNGCTATSAPVSVTASPMPVATISAPSSTTSGAIETASVPQQQGATYEWWVLGGTIVSGESASTMTFQAGGGSAIDIHVLVTIGDCSARGSRRVSVSGSADLAISKSAPPSVSAGANLTWTIQVTNSGPDAAGSVSVVDPLPAGTTFVSATGMSCSHSGGVVTCTTPQLAAGGSATVLLTVTAPQQATTLSNTASVSSLTSDPVSANNSATAATSVIGSPASCATQPPALTSPAPGMLVDSPVLLSWTAVSGATSYEVWISAGGASMLAGTTTMTGFQTALPSGPASWFVVARLAAGCDPLVSTQQSFTVRQGANCALNGRTQITAPAAGAFVSNPVTIGWTPVAQAIGYRVWMSVDGEARQDIGATTGATTLAARIPAGNVVLAVEAIFSGCPGTLSDPVAFTVPADDACSNRGSAQPQSPGNNSVLSSSDVTFQWAPAPNADGYRVWVSINGGAPAVAGVTTEETSLNVNIVSGDVFWWVEALYEGCASTESTRFRFLLPALEQCGTAVSQLLSPAHNSLVGSPNVNFVWTNVPDAINYELWASLADGSPVLLGTTTGTSMTQSVPSGNLQWFVRLVANRCPKRDSLTFAFERTLPEECESLRRPADASPADRDRVVSPVDFRWSDVAGAVRYELFILRGGTPQLVLSTTEAKVDAVPLPQMTGRWFVRAYTAGNCSIDSDERVLEVVARPPSCSTIAAPVVAAPAEMSSGIPFNLQWSSVPGATAYQLQISATPGFEGAEIITTPATLHQIVRTNPSGLPLPVYVRVRAIDTSCTPVPAVSPYSPTTAIFILPPESAIGAAPPVGGIVHYTIELGPELAGQSFTAVANQPFFTITPASGVVPAGGMTLNVSVDTSALPLGTTLGGVTVTLSTPAARGPASHATTSLSSLFSINIVSPVSPVAKSSPPPDALIIPAVAHAAGINSLFQSDVRVSNTSPQVMQYQLTFTPTGESGIASGRQTTFSIDPGRTIALDDILKGWFGTGSSSATGTLEVRPMTQTSVLTSVAGFGPLANMVTFASSRTYNATPNGTFGQYIPAIPFANFLGKAAEGAGSSLLSLQQIAQSDRYRTNLGLVEGSGEPVDLLVKVFGSSGQMLTSFPLSLKGGQHTQLNSFLVQHGLSDLEDGRIEVQVTSSTGKVTAYASVLDNQTNDPLLVTPVTLGEAGNTKWVLPGVANIANGLANWQTDMRVFNAGEEDVEVNFVFHSQNGGTPLTKALTIAPGKVEQIDQLLSTLFGVSQDGGAVHLETVVPARLIATARTYNETGEGTYGQFISAVTPSESIGVGSRALQLLQVEESERYRSNIGLAEVTGNPVTLEVSVTPPDAKFTAFVTIPLQGNEFRQIGSLLASMGFPQMHNARVTVKAVEGLGRATAYASVIDLQTQDPTYVPAQ